MTLIALMTDFGTDDLYVASMKLVLAGRTSVPVIDLTHAIPPFDIFHGAWTLACAEPLLPPGSVTIAVVDPGVGSSRRLLCARSGERFFVAPDNGLVSLLTGVLDEVREIENPAHFLDSGSTTFHGRDRLAPVAAALADGLDPAVLGRIVSDMVLLPYEAPRYNDSSVAGQIVSIDHFGNCVTDIKAGMVPWLAHARLETGYHVIGRWARDYQTSRSDPFLIVGSGGQIEISMSEASAATVLQLRRFEPVVLMRGDV